MSLAAWGVTHAGRRSANEDAWLVDPSLGLLMVADGMGGHNAGEVASALAIETVRDFLAGAGEGPSGALLEEAVQYANDRILASASEHAERSGMGTTIAAVLSAGERLFYTSVGDSRIYLWRSGALTRLTKDDSWVASTLGATGSGEAQARNHPMRHVLTKVVGLVPDLEATAAECTLEAGDTLLICSDGVHGAVSDEALAAILGRGTGVRETAEGIVRSAIENNAADNVTAVVARLGDEQPPQDR